MQKLSDWLFVLCAAGSIPSRNTYLYGLVVIPSLGIYTYDMYLCKLFPGHKKIWKKKILKSVGQQRFIKITIILGGDKLS